MHIQLFYRSEAGDDSAADMFYRKGADIRQPFKPLLSNIVIETLSLEPSNDDVALEDLLSKKDIIQELFTIGSSQENKDKASEMLAYHNLLINLGNER